MPEPTTPSPASHTLPAHNVGSCKWTAGSSVGRGLHKQAATGVSPAQHAAASSARPSSPAARSEAGSHTRALLEARALRTKALTLRDTLVLVEVGARPGGAGGAGGHLAAGRHLVCAALGAGVLKVRGKPGSVDRPAGGAVRGGPICSAGGRRARGSEGKGRRVVLKADDRAAQDGRAPRCPRHGAPAPRLAGPLPPACALLSSSARPTHLVLSRLGHLPAGHAEQFTPLPVGTCISGQSWHSPLAARNMPTSHVPARRERPYTSSRRAAWVRGALAGAWVDKHKSLLPPHSLL